MAYAQCKNKECGRVLSRSGKRGFKLEYSCCPACGSDLKNAKMPKYWTEGQAVSKWHYEDMQHDSEWVAEMCKKNMTWLGVIGHPNRTELVPRPYEQKLINELMAFCL